VTFVAVTNAAKLKTKVHLHKLFQAQTCDKCGCIGIKTQLDVDACACHRFVFSLINCMYDDIFRADGRCNANFEHAQASKKTGFRGFQMAVRDRIEPFLL
jgi:hypothetical protein